MTGNTAVFQLSELAVFCSSGVGESGRGAENEHPLPPLRRFSFSQHHLVQFVSELLGATLATAPLCKQRGKLRASSCLCRVVICLLIFKEMCQSVNLVLFKLNINELRRVCAATITLILIYGSVVYVILVCFRTVPVTLTGTRNFLLRLNRSIQPGGSICPLQQRAAPFRAFHFMFLGSHSLKSHWEFICELAAGSAEVSVMFSS